MQQAPPVTPSPSAPPAVEQVIVPQNLTSEAAQDPVAVLQGFRAQRNELQDQLSSLEDMRRDLGRELTREPQTDAQRAGIEKRLSDVDARIAATDARIAAADAQVAAATAVPGATIEPPPIIVQRSGPDEDIVAMSLVFLFILFMPIVIAYSRRIWRRSAAVAATALPGELMERFGHLEQSVDAIAVEVERIGEGQRFMTRVLSDSGVTAELIAERRNPLQAG